MTATRSSWWRIRSIKVMYTRRGLSDTVVYDEAGIMERDGVLPEAYPSWPRRG